VENNIVQFRPSIDPNKLRRTRRGDCKSCVNFRSDTTAARYKFTIYYTIRRGFQPAGSDVPVARVACNTDGVFRFAPVAAALVITETIFTIRIYAPVYRSPAVGTGVSCYLERRPSGRSYFG